MVGTLFGSCEIGLSISENEFYLLKSESSQVVDSVGKVYGEKTGHLCFKSGDTVTVIYCKGFLFWLVNDVQIFSLKVVLKEFFPLISMDTSHDVLEIVNSQPQMNALIPSGLKTRFSVWRFGSFRDGRDQYYTKSGDTLTCKNNGYSCYFNPGLRSGEFFSVRIDNLTGNAYFGVYSTSGYYHYLYSDGTVCVDGQYTGTAQSTPVFKNGDVVSVLREGNKLSFFINNNLYAERTAVKYPLEGKQNYPYIYLGKANDKVTFIY